MWENASIRERDPYLKLLVVDDDEIIRERLKILGEKIGFSVTTAKDGAEAWEIFRELQEVSRPDLVILDIYMPRMNGLLVLHKIKELSPHTPVILITGYLHYKQLIKKDYIRPEGFVTKPFHMEEIANMMLELVEDHIGEKARIY